MMDRSTSPKEMDPRGLGREKSRGFDVVGGIVVMLTLGVAIGGRPSEEVAADAVREALDTSGHVWVEAQITGRGVRLWGTAPSASIAADAERVARSAMCETWVGQRPCARDIELDVDSRSFAWPELEGTVSKRVLTLKGVIPDAATRDVLQHVSRGAIRSDLLHRVVDDTESLGKPAPPGVDATVDHFMAVATMCEEGDVSLAAGVLSIRCHVAGDREAALLDMAARRLPAGRVGEIVVTKSTVPVEDRT